MIGIDLGTTNSLVAVLQSHFPAVLANELNEKLTPSVVAVAEDGELLVGRAARDRLVVDPKSGVACFKRDMGTDKVYHFGGRDWTPTECSAVVLREMKRIAELHLNEEIKEAVVTVPAYFRDEQRNATVEAAKIAGMSVERLINEPTAAALAHGYRDSDKENLLFVFDLGGGTFDVTLLETFNGVIEVKASGGVSRLGGEDYTDALVDWVLSKTNTQTKPEDEQRWRQQVEGAKRRLSQQERTTISRQGIEIEVTRDDFEKAGRGITAKIRPVINRCLRDAGISASELEDVLLVGGATRMPLTAKLVGEELKREPNTKIDPDQVVAMGAAVQAALIEGDEAVEDIVLTDVCSHSLGVEIANEVAPGKFEEGYFEPIIDRNTIVPTSHSKVFNTLHPQQDEVRFGVYQGEGRLVKDNRKIGEIRVKGMKAKPGQKYPGQVDVRFTYDMNGLLEVEATILDGGKKVTQVFEQRPGSMSKKAIKEAMELLQPLKVHPRDKLPNRARIERANRLYEDLIGIERERLAQVVMNFEMALESQDIEAIHLAGETLDAFMAPFFQFEGLN